MVTVRMVKQRIASVLYGDTAGMPYRQRVYILLSWFIAMIAASGLLVNIATGMNAWVTAVTAVGTTVFVLFALYIRSGASYERTIMPFFWTSISLLAASWFLNGGSDSNLLSLLYAFFLGIYAVASPVQRRIVAVVFALLIPLLVIAHHYFPSFIVPYDSADQRFADLLFGSLLYYLFLYAVIDVIISYFDTENERIRRYNEALEQGNKRLNESEAKYRASIETSIDAIHIIDESGNLYDANEAFLRHLGYTREEAANLRVMDWDAQWDSDEIMAQIGRMMRESGRFETVHRRRDGSLADVEISANRVVIGGRPLLYCAGRDVTEWKRKNDQMVKSERLFRQVWDQSADGMRLTDAEGTIIRVNDAYCRLVGRHRSELEGRPLSVLFSAEKGEPAMRKHRENFSHHRINEASEKKVEMWDGRTVWLMISNSYVLTEGNRLLLLGMFRDITERKRIQDELTSYNGLLTSMLEHLPFDFWARDRSGRGILQSKIGAERWGSIVHPASDEQPAAAQTAGQWERNNVRALAGETVRNEQEYRDDATGRTRTYYEIVAPYYADDTVAGILGINIDVTDQKRAQADLREQKQNLETLISNLPGYVYRAVDTDGSPRILFLSAGVEGVTGYTAAELRMTVDVMTVIHPDDVEHCREVTRNAVRSRDRYELEYRITSKHGDVRWVLERGRGVYDAKGRYEYTEGYVVDITGQKSVEHRLFESFQQNDAIFTQASVGMAVTDMNGRFLRINQAFVAMLGHSPERLVRLSVRDVTVPEDYEKELDNMRAVIAGETRSFSIEKRMRKSSGGIVWVRADIVLIRDAHGVPEYFTGIVQDVTQQHLISNAIRNLAVLSAEPGKRSAFDSIVSNMATALQADTAFIGVLADDGSSVETVAVWSNGGVAKNFRYSLAGTPCEKVLENGTVYHPERVAELFPEDTALARMGAESYLGMSLIGSNGTARGVLVGLSQRPFHDIPNYAEIQMLFGERAVSELERIEAEAALRRSEEEHRFLVENAHDVIVRLNFRGIVTYCSPSIASLGGYDPETVIGTSIKRYMAEPDRTLDVFRSMKDAVLNREAKAIEFKFRRCDGGAGWVEAMGKPVQLETGEVQVHAVLRDISVRKRSEEVLLQYKRILSATIDSISLIDDQYRYIVVNDVYRRRLGRPEESIIGRTVAELFGEQVFRDTMKVQFDRCLRGEEVHYQSWFDFEREGRRYMDVQYMPYRTDGFNGVLVSSRDITEVERAEEAVLSSERRFRTVWESSSEAMRLTNAEGVIVLVNEAYCRLVGLPADRLTGRPHSVVYQEAEHPAVMEEYRRNFSARTFLTYVEAPLTYRNGTVVHVQISNTLLSMPNGESLLLSGFRDITARVEAERERKRSEERYHGIVNTALDGFLVVDLEGRFTEVNDVYCRMVGYTKEELLTMRISDVERVEDPAKTKEHISRMMETGGDRFESKHRTRRGDTIFVEVSTYYLADQRIILAFIANITKRKEDEAGLIESERRFRSTVENVSLVGVMLDVDGRIRTVNDHLLAVTGWNRSDLVGRSWFEMLVPADEREQVRTRFNDAVEEGRIPVHHEGEIMTKKGERRYILWNNIYLYDRAGNIIGITSLGDDATEKRRTLEELRASKEQYQLLTENSLDIIALHDRDAKFLYISPAVRHVLGIEESDVIGRSPYEFIHPDDIPSVRDDVHAAALRGEQHQNAVMRIRHRDGSYVWIEMKSNPIKDPATGAVVRIQTISRDITSRKWAEDALHEREEQYRTLITTMQQGVALHEVVKDDDGSVVDYRFLDLNPSYERMTGLTHAKAVGMTVRELLPNIESYWIEKFGHVALTGEPLSYENYAADIGKYFEVIAYRPKRDQFAVIVTDVTERRRSEEVVKESERKYRLLAENSTDVIWTMDFTGALTYISPSVLQLRGFTPDEVLRQTAEEMTCVDSRSLMSSIVSKHLRQARTGEPAAGEYYEIEQPRKNGTTVWTEVVTHLMYDSLRNPVGVLGVSRDITERKRREDLLTTRFRISEYANAHTVKELLRRILDEAESITESTIGFFHFVEDDQKTIALQTWSSNTLRNMCTAEGDGKHYPVDKAGVWVDCLHARAPVVHNDFAALTHRRGLPEGHAPVVRELLVPILRNDKVVAVMGLGNKPYLYDQRDVEIVSQLATMSWDILERRRAELEVFQQERSLEGLSRAAVALINMTETNASETITAALASLGTGLNVDRVYIFRNDESAPVGTVLTSMEYEWVADGITREIENPEMHGLDMTATFPEMHRALSTGEAYRRTVQDAEGEELRIFESQGIRSLILVPIHLHGSFWGFLGVDSVREERRWTDEEQSVLRVASESFGVALERRAAVAMLHESEQILKLALEASGDGIWIYTVPTKEIFYSEETLRLTGYTVHDAPTTFDAWMELVHPDDRPAAVEAMARHLRREESVFVNEHRFKVADGSYRWMLDRGKVLRWDEQGRPYQIYGTYSDIHNRKESERNIIELNERLEQKVEERTSQLRESIQEIESFSYSISHDLRAPVRAIDSFAKFLNDAEAEKMSDEGRQYLNTVRTTTARMGRMIDDLLQFSRASRAEIQKTRFDMTRLVTKLLDDAAAVEPGRNIERRIGPLPMAYGDASLLGQALVNLFSNAVKFTRNRPHALIEVGGTVRDGMTVFWVTDNGTGFDMKYREKLFGVFQRLHSQQEYEGTGVGLAIVHRIVQKHGGTVDVTSAVDDGTTFTIAIPEQGEPDDDNRNERREA